MYKISVPIATNSIRDEYMDEDLNRYLEYFKKGNVERVFIACLETVYSKSIDSSVGSYKLKKCISFFKENGFETGVWIGGFGHGGTLSHDGKIEKKRDYQKLTGVMGESFEHGYCPSDENFAADYLETVTRIAKLDPDLIMLDDDFRLNCRHYFLGCFCPYHLNEFYKAVGEEVPREKIEELIYTGGKNKYRDAYMDLSKKTLEDFAKKVRKAVEEVNPCIRVGICTAYTVWDLEGTDGIELAKAISGLYKPFLRTFGAPYHDMYALINTIENVRMQNEWVKKSGTEIELFAEGDVYPRPVYNVPSKSLELFDLAMICDGKADGILKYMFDYTNNVGYETGYIDNHIRNIKVKKEISEVFNGKKASGIYIYRPVHLIRDWVLPKPLVHKISEALYPSIKNTAADLISKNSIPTSYEDSGYPAAVFGETARHIPLELLKNGAVLDAVAAEILMQRGVDTGLVRIKRASEVNGELFINANDRITGIENVHIYEMICREGAVPSSYITPLNTCGAYTYENDDGIRFFVLAADVSLSPSNANYFNNYYRREQLVSAFEWVGGKKLPAVAMKNPNLYIMTSKADGVMSVLLMNIFMDDIYNAEIKLDMPYSSIKFINCSGSLDGDTVHISEISAYGFAAVEVR